MIRNLTIFISWYVLFSICLVFQSKAEDNLTSYADIVEKVLPSVVSISINHNNNQPVISDLPDFPSGSPFEKFFKDFNTDSSSQPLQKASSIGSGFIVSSDGIIMTNAHVIDNAQKLDITFSDGSKNKASLLNLDKKTDIALLKVATDYPLTPIVFGDSSKARIGDKIIAIGNPFGLGITVSSGIISARARDIQIGPYDDFLQTDAPINRGNSGGPMFNVQGEVIGINTAIFSPSGGSVGIGFAIPSNMASDIYNKLMTHGKISRGQIGVKVQTVTKEIAENLGMPQAKGALIANISNNSSAYKAGIKIGDVILSINNTPINIMRDLPRLVAQSPINQQVPITLWRNGKEYSTLINIEEMKDETSEVTSNTFSIPLTSSHSEDLELPELGLSIANINEETKEQYNLSPDSKGVVITSLSPTITDTAQELAIGDIIIEVKQTPIVKTSDVQALIKASQNQKLKSVLMLVHTQEGIKFIALRLR